MLDNDHGFISILINYIGCAKRVNYILDEIEFFEIEIITW